MRDVRPTGTPAAKLRARGEAGAARRHARAEADESRLRARAEADESQLRARGEAEEARLRARVELGEAAAVEAFWVHLRRRGEPLRPAIAKLTELALSCEPVEAARGTRLLFAEIVEPLCDAFTAAAAEVYRRAFAQVITAARASGECRGLDVALGARGIHSERDLLRRRDVQRGARSAATALARSAPTALARSAPTALAPVHATVPLAAPSRMASGAVKRSRVRRVTVLSRLTLGADVAICLPMLARAVRLFPKAEIRFVGAEGARVVSGGVPGVRHVPADYGRNDRLCDRLNAWLGVCAAVADGGVMAPGESIVLDPDSRLTQLGLLRPVASRDYYHFPSRSRGEGESASLGALAADWLDETFAAEDGGRHSPPKLMLAPQDAEWSRALRSALLGAAAGRRNGPDPARTRALVRAAHPDGAAGIVSVSFGVGGNDRKRVGTEFEVELIEWMVARGWRVLLARGAGASEVARSIGLGERLAARGIEVLHLERGRRLPDAPGLRGRGHSDVVTWEADVGAFLAAIACADIYVGYDSAGHHLAAALGVPTLSVFVEAAGRRHALRWTPLGPGLVRVLRSACPANERSVLERAKAEFVRLSERPHAGRSLTV